MAVFQTGTLQLPNEIAGKVIAKVRETSTIAKLAPESAGTTLLNDQYELVTTDPEAEVIGEGVAKTQGSYATSPIISATHKAVVTLRFSREALYADEDAQLGLLDDAFQSMGAANSRALDYIVYHAVSPKGAAPISGATALSTAANQQTATADVVADIDALPDDIIENGYNVSGIALATTFANELRKARVGDDQRKAFPDIPLDVRQAGSLDGVNVAVSNTVNGQLITPATGIKAFAGDFSMLRWGIVRSIPTRLIEYGDPDNTGHDLQGYNEIALRAEVIFKTAVLDPKAFTVLKASA